MTVDLLESSVSDTLSLNTLEFSSAIDQQLGAGQDGLSLSTLLSLYRDLVVMRARMTQIRENIPDSESGAFGLAKSNKDLAELGLVFTYHWVKPRSHDMKQSLSHMT